MILIFPSINIVSYCHCSIYKVDSNWVVSAFAISVALLAASVLVEFSSRRRLQHH
jgi:hypothetical protein